MFVTEREQVFRALRTAIDDAEAGRSAYYNGPCTPLYLATRTLVSEALDELRKDD